MINRYVSANYCISLIFKGSFSVAILFTTLYAQRIGHMFTNIVQYISRIEIVNFKLYLEGYAIQLYVMYKIELNNKIRRPSTKCLVIGNMP